MADGGEVVQLDGHVGVSQPSEHLGLPDRPELLLDVDEFGQLAFDVGVRPIRASLVDSAIFASKSFINCAFRSLFAITLFLLEKYFIYGQAHSEAQERLTLLGSDMGLTFPW